MESRPTRILAAAAAALLVLAGAGWAQGPDPDRHIVKFRDGKGAQGLAALRGANAEVLLQLAPQNAAAARIPSHALAGLRQNPNIEYIEVDPPRYPMAQSTPYGIKMVQADPDSAGIFPGSSARKVCIIDSGYSINHEDLKSGAGVTGYPSGWDNDTCFHGSHVAGTISAMDNSAGVVGVMPGNSAIQLHIVKVFDGANCGWSYASTLVDASNRCASAGANVISMSLGCSGNRCSSTTENNAFQTHYNNGILNIAAAGNAGNTQKSYPASYASVVSVAAVDSASVLASFSQRNDAVEIAAPGVAVRSTVGMGAGKEESLAVGGTGYEAIAMDGSPNANGSGGLVDCGLGGTTCSGASGKVCLIERGSFDFSTKVLSCQNGGGTAAVIYNNIAGLFSGTLGGVSTTIPSVGISQADGQFLKANRIGSSSTVSVATGNYAYYDGTSMATPHVSGVMALVWSHNTGWTNANLRSTMQGTAIDLGAAGKDNSYGYGLIQAKAMLCSLQPGNAQCDGGEPPPPGNNPPTASFTSSCTELSCDFTDTSSDSDGTVVAWSWSFGDGGTSTAQNPSRTYAADGTYTVGLTVTDDDGATHSTSANVTVSATSPPPPGGITLSAVGYKVRGNQQADLSWSGATSTNVDVFRDNVKITTTANDGAHTDNINKKGGGSYTYRVCEAGTSTCSNNATVSF